MEKIVVGVIGAGGNTKLRHMPELLKQAGVEIKRIANRTKASAEAVAQQFGLTGDSVATGDWRDVINDPEINAVVIGTWPYMHAQLTIASLQAGKHVLCEARAAMNAKEAHHMLDVSRQHPDLIAQIVPSPYTLPYDATIQDIIQSEKLGELLTIRVKGITGQFPDSSTDADSPPKLSWRQDRRYSGLNILSMGIIYEALSRWVGGATKVMAMTKTGIKCRVDPETSTPVAVTVPDHVDILAEMACGAQAHYVFSALCGASPGPVHEFWLHGSKGTLHLDVDNGVLELAEVEKGGKFENVEIDHGHRGSWRVEEEFVNAIRGTEKVRLTDLETAVQYMEFTEAVARSAQSGQAVALPLLDL